MKVTVILLLASFAAHASAAGAPSSAKGIRPQSNSHAKHPNKEAKLALGRGTRRMHTKSSQRGAGPASRARAGAPHMARPAQAPGPAAGAKSSSSHERKHRSAQARKKQGAPSGGDKSRSAFEKNRARLGKTKERSKAKKVPSTPNGTAQKSRVLGHDKHMGFFPGAATGKTASHRKASTDTGGSKGNCKRSTVGHNCNTPYDAADLVDDDMSPAHKPGGAAQDSVSTKGRVQQKDPGPAQKPRTSAESPSSPLLQPDSPSAHQHESSPDGPPAGQHAQPPNSPPTRPYERLWLSSHGARGRDPLALLEEGRYPPVPLPPQFRDPEHASSEQGRLEQQNFANEMQVHAADAARHRFAREEAGRACGRVGTAIAGVSCAAGLLTVANALAHNTPKKRDFVAVYYEADR